MATKKKTEVEATEEVKEVEATEEVKEEAPKKTTRKSSKKKAEVEEVSETVEEAPVEEVKEEPKAEVEVVGSKVAEVVEEPKPVKPTKVEKVEEVKVSDDSYLVQVVSTSGIFTFKNPGLDQPKGRVYPKGAKLAVTGVSGNWGKVGENCWILLSGAVVKI